MITMEGQKKVNENCIVQIKIMYSDHARAFYSEPFYMGNGKVNSVTFLPSGKLDVEVDIGVVSAKDYKTKQRLPKGRRSDYAEFLEYAIVEELINLPDAIANLNKFANLDKESI